MVFYFFLNMWRLILQNEEDMLGIKNSSAQSPWNT